MSSIGVLDEDEVRFEDELMDRIVDAAQALLGDDVRSVERLQLAAALRSLLDQFIVWELIDHEAAPTILRQRGWPDPITVLATAAFNPHRSPPPRRPRRPLRGMLRRLLRLEGRPPQHRSCPHPRRRLRHTRLGRRATHAHQSVVGMSLAQTQKSVRRWKADQLDKAAAAKGETPIDPADAPSTVTFRRNGNRWTLHGDLSHTDGMTLAAELNRRRHTDPTTGQPDDCAGQTDGPVPPDPFRTAADRDRPWDERTGAALLATVRRSNSGSGNNGRSAPEVVLVADVRHLTADDASFGFDGFRTVDGHALMTSTFERLTCDATIRRALIGADGAIVVLGRAVHSIPQDLRRALELRDGGCAWITCTVPASECEGHHLKHWTKHNGQTNLDDLALLCSSHHHEGHSTGLFFLECYGQLHMIREDGTHTTLCKPAH